MPEDAGPKHIPQNRDTAESKLRRSRVHCPVCLAPLRKNVKRTKRMNFCTACGANPQPGKQCARCSGEAVWEGRAGAACQSCGLHGSKSRVIARSEQS